jgi:hypothetical protein
VGPKSEEEALAWIKEAVPAGRYVPAVHFQQRLIERHFDMFDVFSAVERATRLLAYDREAVHGGTCWRLFGPDVDGTREVALGFEAFLDKKRRRVVLCTLFDPEAP